MKVALIQMNSGADKAANLEQARGLIEDAMTHERPDWICLPEVFDFMGGSRADKLAAAEAMPGGPAYTLMRDLAKKHRVFIHAGSMLEKIEGEQRVGNTTVAFNRDGDELGRYRKIHMFDITAPDGAQYNESASFKPGGAVVTYDVEGVTVGCSICYDLRFPALFQALADRGAQVIAMPAAFTLQTGKDHWEVLIRARAIETETYFCASAQTGTHMQGNDVRATWGHSMLVDPWGAVTARASDGVGWAAGRIDPERVAKVRAMIPVAKHKLKLS
jgi:predicted amidohydrolase